MRSVLKVSPSVYPPPSTFEGLAGIIWDEDNDKKSRKVSDLRSNVIDLCILLYFTFYKCGIKLYYTKTKRYCSNSGIGKCSLEIKQCMGTQINITNRIATRTKRNP